MANVIKKEVEVAVERQSQLTTSLCNCGWGNYAVDVVCVGGTVDFMVRIAMLI